MTSRTPTLLLALSLALVLGCPNEAKQASRPIAAPVKVAPPVAALPDGGQEPDVVVRWGNVPANLPRATRKGGTLERDGDQVHLRLAGGGFSVPADPGFGECIDAPPQSGPPRELDEAATDGDEAWIIFESEQEGVALRLSPYGAELFTQPDCLRRASLQPYLFGPGVDSEDPIFSNGVRIPELATELGTAQGEFAGAVDPPKTTPAVLSGTTTGELFVAGSTAGIRSHGAPLLDVSYDPVKLQRWQASLASFVDGADKWTRFAVSGELPVGTKASLNREDTLVWRWVAGQPSLLLEVSAVYLSKEPGYEDARIRVDRTAQTATGDLRIRGQRTTVEDVRMIGAGRCPEMEGVLEYTYVEEEVEWIAVGADGTEHKLADVSRKVTQAAGCLSEARREAARALKSRRSPLPDTRVRWSAPSAWPASASPMPSVSGSP